MLISDELRKLLEDREAITPEQKALSAALLQRLEKHAGSLPLEFKFNRDEANER